MPQTAERASPPGEARHVNHPAKGSDGSSVQRRADEGATEHRGAGVRAAAVAAAERGYYVFPTRPGGKEPRRGLSWPGVATCDPARVAVARWRPGEGYGIAAKLSGLVILDLDRPKPGHGLPADWHDEPGIVDGKDVLATLAGRAGQGWPSTFTVATPSGGWHLYFRAPAGRAIGNRPAGPLIDVRGGGESNGGYVLGPGSVLNGRAYTVVDGQDPVPLPGWIADLLDPREPVTRPVAPVVTMPRSPGGRYADKALLGEIERVLQATEGGRNHALNRAAYSLGQLVAGGHLSQEVVATALHQAGEAAGLDAGEVRRTVASGLTSGLRQPRRAS